jgi:hypothetical protein
VSRSKQPDSKQERQWVEAKRRCRLNREDIRMARELGLNPRTLIKNIPAPNQQWKLPVKQWLHELYEKNTGKPPPTKPRSSPRTHGEPAVNDAAPLHACENESVRIPAQAHAPPNEIMADWEAYAEELRNVDGPPWLPGSRL